MSENLNRHQCVILVPSLGPIEPGCEQALDELNRRGYPIRRVFGWSDISMGRCAMASEAMEDGYRETMWIDSDINFHPDDVDKLRSRQLPIVAGVYARKNGQSFAASWLNTGEAYEIKFGPEGSLVEVAGVGCGFMHVRKSVYDLLATNGQTEACNRQFGKPMTSWFLPLIVKDDGEPRYLSEDYAFCHRCRQSGIKVMADLSVSLIHVGSYGYNWQHVKGWETAHGKDFLVQV